MCKKASSILMNQEHLTDGRQFSLLIFSDFERIKFSPPEIIRKPLFFCNDFGGKRNSLNRSNSELS